MVVFLLLFLLGLPHEGVKASLSCSSLGPQHPASCQLLVGAQLNTPWTSLVAQTVKRLPTMRETRVQSLGWGDPLEKEMANPLQHSCLENPTDGGA